MTWRSSRRLNVVLLSLFRLVSQGFLKGPSFSKSPMQSADGNANFCRPIREAERFSVECDLPNKRRAIARLFLWCCPAAVFRRISFRSVSPVYTVRSGRFWSHVGVEVLKRLPSLAYCNAVPSIVRKVFRVRIIAAVIHSLPRDVFRCTAHSVLSFTTWLAAVATVPSECRATNRSLFPAATSTQPVCSFRWISNVFCNYRPITKRFPRQIFETRMMLGRLVFSHDASLISRVVRTASQSPLIGCSHFSTFAIGGQI